MTRSAKSQWDFGELFPAQATRRVFTVTELTTEVKRNLERQFGQLWVSGEISNFRLQSSGHAYFTLKDASAQLSCVLFRGTTTPHRQLLGDGRKVLLQGDLTVYEPRGQYQLVVRSVELQGVGALQVAFELLKQKLQAEGLFASERKRPIPRYPQRLGLVTSPTGAAIRDVLHVIRRRHPCLHVVLAPCRVQGEGAAAEISAALALLNAWSRGELPGGPDSPRPLDLILLTRGGGSLEDLWAFNEEAVARAIAASDLPVVSAVGHEIDITISDWVADLRAATPSAAAEIITEHVHASREPLADFIPRAAQRVRTSIAHASDRLDYLQQRLLRVHPRRLLEEQLQRLDDLLNALGHAIRSRGREHQVTVEHLRQRLSALRPARQLTQLGSALQDQNRRLRDAARLRLRELQAHLQHHDATLRLLSPMQVLERGYSITWNTATGRTLRDTREVHAGQRITTRLRDGTLDSVVEPPAPASVPPCSDPSDEIRP